MKFPIYYQNICKSRSTKNEFKAGDRLFLFFITKIRHFVPIKIIKNRGYSFVFAQRNAARCIGEQNKMIEGG